MANLFTKLFVLLLLGTSSLHANVFNTRHQPQDMWQALRESFQLSLYPNQAEVQKQIKWIKNHPQYIKILSRRATPYLFFILQRVKKNELPGEIALLPMIESTYNPFAYSGVGAAGLWQLMPGTGTGLGLRQDWWYDGRRGIHTSTKAALDYLKYLSRFFNGNWTLAIAAYDSGEGTVKRAIDTKKQRAENADFWQLNLPRETQAYIPRLLALALVIKYPKYYGIQLPHFPYKPYFVKVEVGSQIDLTHAAKLAGISYAELIKLNPGYNRWATAPNQAHTLVLPIESVDTFRENLENLPKEKRVTWQRHSIKQGDTLSQIAQRYRSNVELIKSINHIQDESIQINQILLIPNTKYMSQKTITETRRKQAINHASSKGPIKIVHIVKPGDTLGSLEKKYRTHQAAIRFWNKLSSNQLQPNQRIIIWQRRSRAKIHKVKAGESLSVIAQQYHLSVTKLKQLNPQIQNNIIKANQVLKLS